MENIGLFKELSISEASDIYGGDWLESLGYKCRVTYNRACKVISDACGAVADFCTSGDARMNETLMNCI